MVNSLYCHHRNDFDRHNHHYSIITNIMIYSQNTRISFTYMGSTCF
jgi:hypothetical protein